MSGARRIDVRLLPENADRSYPLWVDGGVGAEERVAAELAARHPGRVVGVLSDENVTQLHGARFLGALEDAGFRVIRAVIPAGEASKRLASVEAVATTWAAGGLDRSGVVLALGGGVVGDLAGVTASLYMRGVPFVQVPTTLMAQVDSSIGGKTGVNLDAGKNLLGTFHQPLFVYADATTLATLPPRELASGLAEVVKHGVIADQVLLSICEKRADSVRSGDARVLEELVLRSCAVKAIVVAADEREQDPRAKGGGRARLNFGHTVGHALEAESLARDSDPLLHGEAVALGMLAALHVATVLGFNDGALGQRLERVLGRLGLPIDWRPRLTPAALARLAVDKKKTGAHGLRYVVVERVGTSRLITLEEERLTEILLDGK